MAQYRKVVDKNNNPMYFDGEGTRVGADKVPGEVISALDNQPEGNFVTDDLKIVEAKAEGATVSTDDLKADEQPEEEAAKEASEAEDEAPLPPADSPLPPATAPTAADDGEGEVTEPDDGIDEEETQRTERQLQPVQGDSGNEDQPMGFPTNKEGRTLSIFGKNVHQTVRFVYGIMVPLTNDELVNKTDEEIGKKLRKLGKI